MRKAINEKYLGYVKEKKRYPPQEVVVLVTDLTRDISKDLPDAT